MSQEDFDPRPGEVIDLEPDLRFVLAPNPSPMTFRGTNTYLLGRGDVAVIDPGPMSAAHLTALLRALDNGENVSHIFVTHSHRDHSCLAPALAEATGAPVLAFGPSDAGRSPTMAALADAGLAGGGEGVDAEFRPDICLTDGDSVAGASWRLTAVGTPGHMANHLAFRSADRLFSGDHVMGWSTSIISPPDGDMAAFMPSCRKLLGAGDRVYYPGHGAPVWDPEARVRALLDHRLGRETQILSALSQTPQNIPDLTQQVYPPLAPGLQLAAERNVFAHLIDLCTRGLAEAHPTLTTNARYCLGRESKTSLS